MRKVMAVTCIAVLLLASLVVTAGAAANNWTVFIRAFSDQWTSSQSGAVVGLTPTGSTALAYNSPAAYKVYTVIQETSTYLTKRIWDSDTTTLPITWDLRIGQGSSAFNSLKIAVYSQELDLLDRDVKVDTDLIYILRNGDSVIASFASQQNSSGLTNWVDINELIQPKGWFPSPSDTGWYYEDTTPTTSSTYGGLEAYSLEVLSP